MRNTGIPPVTTLGLPQISLPGGSQQVLGADLNRSESSRVLAAAYLLSL
jgi:hypothetical protein